MSFNDLERGLHQQAPLARDGPFTDHPNVDQQFRVLANKVATHVFRINSNSSGIQKLLDVIGTSRDSPGIRSKLHDLLEATREFVKHSSNDVKELAGWKVADDKTQQRIEQHKISREYAAAIQSFQRVSRQSAERQKQFVERAKRASESEVTLRGGEEVDAVELSDTTAASGKRQQEAHQQQQLVQSRHDVLDEGELQYQESLVAQREAEIREIETGILELNEIFRDLGAIVTEQGGLIDNIESNVNSVQRDTQSAGDELSHAHEYQRKAGKRMLCLLLIFCVVLAIVLLAVLA